MNLTSLTYFEELAKVLNFTKAAENMHTTQQALSQNIQRLEDMYGVTLFERKPHVKLTYAGTVFLEEAKKILKEEQDLRARLSYVTANQCGTITLGIPAGRAHGFLTAIVPQFKHMYPNILISLVEANTYELEKLLLQGDIDVMIGSLPTVNRPVDPLFQQSILMDESLYLLATDKLLENYLDNFEQKREVLSRGLYMRDLMDLPLIMNPRTSRIQKIIEQLFVLEGKKPHIFVESSHGSSLLSLCKEGYCGVFILQMILHTTISERPDVLKELNIIPLKDERLKNRVVIACRSDHTLPKYLYDFIEVTKKIFAEYFSSKIELMPRG